MSDLFDCAAEMELFRMFIGFDSEEARFFRRAVEHEMNKMSRDVQFNAYWSVLTSDAAVAQRIAVLHPEQI